ncbi:putative sphingosine kinase A, B [Trypanosoma conorhini]|uniref:Putative sphingosine kinase A, B n=1 Tax=Trypanosoma conorhini TaxID=83891 RepID=A0A3S5IUJ5_9TRYP|nr:putative sphingosine kinase A, B [Trypanosoma conorhini]RNF26237.1 putative sphingosine kinase A, B [Trypanosoma conorhini]
MYPRNGTAQEPGQLPRLQAWVIVNPTSGQGKGELLQRRIETTLRTEFPDCVTRVRTASELMSVHDARLGRKDNHAPLPPLRVASSSSLFYAEGLRTGDPVAGDATMHCSRRSGVRVDIIATEHEIRGREVAEHLTKMVVASRLRRCLNGKVAAAIADGVTTAITSHECDVDSLHVFVAVGGDGSLSDVVNGMCRGTLEAFRKSIATPMHSDEASTGGLDSLQYYWQSLEDRSILRHFLPSLIYVPAGTGTDFARLGLGCRSAREFVALLRSVWGHLMPASPLTTLVRVPPGVNGTHVGKESTTTTARDSTKGSTDDAAPLGFEVYDVDVARVSFPRSRQNYFFINECSCGISCDVIEKCEGYKESKFMSLLGGKLMFAVASIISVCQLRPKPFRLVALPEFASLPSNSLTPRRIGGELPHPHLIMNEAALRGVQHDLQWVKASAWEEALPATEPLRFGANYYAYEVQGASIASDFAAPPADGKTVVNPFYADPSRKEANTPEEIVAAVNDPDPSGRWICLKSSTLAFGNGRWFGGGLQVTPHANPTDGQLSVTSWVAGFAQFVLHAPSLYTGNHTHWPSTTIWNTTRTIIDVDTRLSPRSAAKNSTSRVEALMQSCEADGEILERLPAIIEATAVLTMFVPRGRPGRRIRGGNHDRREGRNMS